MVNSEFDILTPPSQIAPTRNNSDNSVKRPSSPLQSQHIRSFSSESRELAVESAELFSPWPWLVLIGVRNWKLLFRMYTVYFEEGDSLVTSKFCAPVCTCCTIPNRKESLIVFNPPSIFQVRAVGHGGTFSAVCFFLYIAARAMVLSLQIHGAVGNGKKISARASRSPQDHVIEQACLKITSRSW